MSKLVLFDCDKIQTYVYASPRQAEIRLASRRLEAMTEEVREKISKCYEGEPIAVAAASGGAWLSGEDADKKASALENLIRQSFLSIGIACTVCTVDAANEHGFGDAWEMAQKQLREMKDAPRRPVALVGSPLFVPCESTGLGPAEAVLEIGGNQRARLSGVAADHRTEQWGLGDASLDWEKWMAEALDVEKEGFWGNAVCRTTEELGGENPSQDRQAKVALIAADVNDAGKAFRNFGKRERAEASNALRKALATALGKATMNVLGAREGRWEIFPLYVGGDDLMVYVRAGEALGFCQVFCKELMEQQGQFFSPALTVSVGVAFGKEKTPFRQLSEMARRAESRAKQARRSLIAAQFEGANQVCWVEYDVMRGALPITDASGGHHPVSAGPFTVGGENSDDRWALSRLLQALDRLRKGDFPSNKLKSWGALPGYDKSRALAEYTRGVKNLSKTNTEILQQAVAPLVGSQWHDVKSCLPVRRRGAREECPLVDLAVLWDLVEGGAK